MEWRISGSPPPFTLRQTIALAVHLQDVDMVREAVEQGAGQPLAAEDLGPFVEWQIAGHQRGAALVALAEHLEQQLRPALRERHKAKLVDDQQLVAGQLLLQAQQPLLVSRLQELMDQRGGRGETYGHPVLAGGQTEPERHMGLAGAAVAERDHVLPLADVVAARQVEDQHLVQRRDGQEVEAIEALHRREMRLTDPALHHPPLALDQLQLGQTQEIAEMIGAFRRALPRQLVVLAQEGRQLERLEVMGEQYLWRVAHGRSSLSKAR